MMILDTNLYLIIKLYCAPTSWILLIPQPNADSHVLCLHAKAECHKAITHLFALWEHSDEQGMENATKRPTPCVHWQNICTTRYHYLGDRDDHFLVEENPSVSRVFDSIDGAGNSINAWTRMYAIIKSSRCPTNLVTRRSYLQGTVDDTLCLEYSYDDMWFWS